MATARRSCVAAKTGVPGRIRTYGLQIRSLPLYPTELRAHTIQNSPLLLMLPALRSFNVVGRVHKLARRSLWRRLCSFSEGGSYGHILCQFSAFYLHLLRPALRSLGVVGGTYYVNSPLFTYICYGLPYEALA
jgi:hypothetical protein